MRDYRSILRLFVLIILSLGLSVIITRFAAAECPYGMTVYWHLDETSEGIYIDDYGSNNGECVINCPSPDTGIIAGGQTFDGSTNDSIDILADPTFNWFASDSFSIEYWIKKPPGSLSEDEVVVGRVDDSSSLYWWTGLRSGGEASFVLIASNGDGGNPNQFLTGFTDIADGAWHHIVVIRDANTNTNKLYVDGQEEDSKTVTYGEGFISATASLNMGWLNAGAGFHLNGTLDEVALYDRALSEIEISQHYYDGLIGLRWGYCGGCNEVKIMPLGNSITAGFLDEFYVNTDFLVGYRQKLYLNLLLEGYTADFVGSLQFGQAAYPSFDFEHEGHGGWRDDQVAMNIYGWLVDNPADVVLLHIGINVVDVSPDDVEVILDEIDRYSEDIVVILARITKRLDDPSTTTLFNDNVEAMAITRIANGDRIIVVDQENALTYPDDLADGVHPNSGGYEKMAYIWLDALDDFLPVCDLPLYPMIISIPITEGTLSEPYSYQVMAAGNPPPTFSLIVAPDGMTIDPDTGSIQWTPTETGYFEVNVEAVNTEGIDAQTFYIVVTGAPEVTDNTDPDYFSTAGGTWTFSINGLDYFGSDYLRAPPGATNMTAKWTFQIDTAGDYEISAWWAADSSNAIDAPYTISNNGVALATVQVDQTTNGGQFNQLGIFNLEVGELTVELRGTASGYVAADAIQVVFVDGVGSPVANFSASPTNGFNTLTAAFKDLSTGAIETWAWDFDNDGDTDSTIQNPVYTYNSSGIYTVKLTVSGPGGSVSETKINYITVLAPPPVAGFSAVSRGGVNPLTIVFTDLSTGAIETWAWDFDNDGNTDSTIQNPVYTYNSAGIYTVKLTASGPGGFGTEIKLNYVTVANASEAIDNADPSGFSTTGGVWSPSTSVPEYFGTDYLWAPPGTTSMRATWTFPIDTAGDYEISAWWAANPNRAVDAPYTISNNGVPLATVPVDQRANGGQFNPLGATGIYTLNVGELTLELTGAASGYVIADAVQVVFVSGSPGVLSANFLATPTFGEGPLTVNFTDFSTGTIATWSWDFDNDGNIDSNQQNPLYTYSTPGIYSVALTISDGVSSDTETKTDYIMVTGTSVEIDNAEPSGFSTGGGVWSPSTSVPEYFGTDYLWAPPGATSMTATWTFPIDTAGDYAISAWWAANPNRAVDAPYTISNNGVPLATVPVDQRANGGQFNPLGATGIYTLNVGELTLELTGAASGYVIADAVQVVFVSGSPGVLSANFLATPTFGEGPLTVNFTDFSTGTIATWAWDFDNDGNIDSVDQNPQYTYSTPGIYSVALTISDGVSSDTETKTDYIMVTGTSVEIDNADPSGFSTTGGVWSPSTSVPEYFGTDYLWAPPGTTSMRATWTFPIDTAGDYEISAWWAANPNRAVDAPYTISNNGVPLATVPVDQRANGGQFNPLGATGIYTLNVGELTLELTGAASGYVIADAVQVVFVSGSPGVLSANFLATPTFGEGPLTVNFTDFSTGTIATWSWDFDNDGNIDSNQQNPLYTYSTPGIYSVALTISDGVSSDTETKTDYIMVTGTSVEIDNAEPSGFSTGGGVWSPSTSVPEYFGTDYLWAPPGATSMTATWTFPIDTAGDYAISAWWAANPNRAVDAPYTISNNGVPLATVPVDQRANGGQFNPLGATGIYTLNVGELTLELTGAASGYVIADAVQVVFIGN